MNGSGLISQEDPDLRQQSWTIWRRMKDESSSGRSSSSCISLKTKTPADEAAGILFEGVPRSAEELLIDGGEGLFRVLLPYSDKNGGIRGALVHGDDLDALLAERRDSIQAALAHSL